MRALCHSFPLVFFCLVLFCVIFSSKGIFHTFSCIASFRFPSLHRIREWAKCGWQQGEFTSSKVPPFCWKKISKVKGDKPKCPEGFFPNLALKRLSVLIDRPSIYAAVRVVTLVKKKCLGWVHIDQREAK